MTRRILVLCAGAYVAGLEVIELAIMQGLVDRGHTVHCIVNGWSDGDFSARLSAAGIPHSVAYTGVLSVSPRPSRIRSMLDTLRHARGARETVQGVLASFRPDVVVACNRDSVFLLWSILKGHPVLFHAHDVPDVSLKSRIQMGALSRRGISFAAVSEFVRDRLTSLGVSADRIFVVHNGLYTPQDSRPQSRERGETPVVGIAGQVGPWKGHDDLVDALGILHARGVEFSCHVIGRGDAAYIASLKAKAETLAIGCRVTWAGFVHDSDDIYRGLDVLVVPSRFEEAFGLTVSEAGGRGIPVVGTRRGGIPEQIVDGETGFVVESENPPALADALEPLLLSPELRARVGRAARAHITTRFTYDRMVEAFEQVCETTIEHHPAGRPA